MDVAAWNDRLLDVVLAHGDADRPLYFYVDRLTLAEAGGTDEETALADFCAAFRGSMARRRPFGRARSAAWAWLVGGMHGRPPFAAALAMTVLAVTESPLGNINAVYPRQNDLLGLDPVARAPEGYRDDVPYLWETWNAWLRGAGSWAGLPTAHRDDHWAVHQSWARSQALVRHTDRTLIGEWFAQRGIQPGDSLPGPVLLDQFRQWLAYAGQRGTRLRALVGDAHTQSVLISVLEGELRAWDGVVRAGSGRRHVLGQVVLNRWDEDLLVAVTVTSEMVGASVVVFGERQTITADLGMALLDVDLEPRALLEETQYLPLMSHLGVMVGGRGAYLLHEDPDVAGLLEQRTLQLGASYSLLVPDADHDMIRARWLAAGAQVGATEGTFVPGWMLIRGVSLAHDPSEPLPGLPALRVRQPVRLELDGGLRVGPRTYLCDHPPVLLVPPSETARSLVVDGRQGLPLEPQETHADIGELVLDPGTHTIECDGRRTSISLVPFVRAVADGGLAVEFPYVHAEAATATLTLSGAVLRPGTGEHLPVVVRLSDREEAVLLTADGACRRLPRPTAGWIRDLGLREDYLDVRDAACGVNLSDAFLMVRRSARTADPPTVLPLPDRLPDSGAPDRQLPEEPDVLGQLASRLLDLCAALPSRDGELFRRTIARGIEKGRRRRSHVGSGVVTPDRRPPSSSTDRRANVSDDPPDSPYDDALSWLSEQETTSVSLDDFTQTWQWLATRSSRPQLAGQVELARYRLAILGHVETDLPHRRLAVAAPAVVRLRGAAGFAVLCGARPPRLLERLLDPAADDDPLVQTAGLHWFVSCRRQGPRGDEQAPLAVYLEWDSRNEEQVVRGLAALGLQVESYVGDRLLADVPPLRRWKDLAPVQTVSPSRTMYQWTGGSPDSRGWVRCSEDSAPGLYRYRVIGPPVFAWRNEAGAPLRLVDYREGAYLHLTSAVGGPHTRERVLAHYPLGRDLAVSRAYPLPPLVSRGLTLLSGQVPHALEPGVVGGLLHHKGALVYRNVDVHALHRLERILGVRAMIQDHRLLEVS